MRIRRRARRAASLFIALTALMVVTLVGAQLLRSLSRSQRQSRDHAHAIQALWLADSGLARAAAQLRRDGDYAGEIWRPAIDGGSATGASSSLGRVEIVVVKDPADAARRQIRVTAIFPDDPLHRVQHTRQQNILLTSSGVTP